MTPPDENALLLQAIALARSDRKADAHALLHKIVDENPHQEMAWLWLVQTEPDPEQQILILEECLRNNPKSELAKKGLASLRAQMKAAPPPGKTPPAIEEAKPQKPRKPSRGASGIWKIIFVVMLLAVLATLVGGGVLLFPKLKNNLPAIQLPDFLPGAKTSPATRTSALPIPSPTDTATASLTPTVTRTHTITFTPSRTWTRTASPTPTLYLGTPVEGEYSLLGMKPGPCAAFAVPVSGGPRSLTTQPLESCGDVQISPDGTRIAFLSGQNREILQVVNIDGTGLKPVIKLSGGSGFSRSIWSWRWSPDGKKIALVAPGQAKAAPGFLYVVSADGSGAVKQIKNGGVPQANAQTILWSPDNQWIFVWDMGLPDQIPYPSAFRVSDSRSVILSYLKDVPALGPEYHLDWSPDGKFISFLSTGKPITDALPTKVPANQAYIVEAGLDKTVEYIPLPMAEGDFDPSFGALWSPDGSAFLLLNKHTHQLVAIGDDGQIRSRLLTLRDSSSIVQWSPNGQWISILTAWNVGVIGTFLEVVRPDGTDYRSLTTGLVFAPLIWK
jgi:Tol biopolymer transport system component